MITKADLIKSYNFGGKLETLLDKADKKVRSSAECGDRDCVITVWDTHGVDEAAAVKELVSLGYEVQVHRYDDGDYSIRLYW